MRRRDAGRPPRSSSSSAPRATATASRRSRPIQGDAGHQHRRASRRPTSSPSTSRPGSSASRCSSSAPTRTGATAPISRKADQSHRRRPRCWAPSSAQFYDDKPPPRLVLLSHEVEDAELLAEALAVERRPQGRDRTCRSAARSSDLVEHALRNASEALGRRLADTASQAKLLDGSAQAFGLDAAAAPDRGLRQLPHHGHQRRRRA